MKTRIISAIIAAIIVVPLFLLGGWFFNAGVVILAALAYLEILQLKVSHNTLPSAIRIMGFLGLELITLSNFNIGFSSNSISYLSIGITCLLLLIPSIFDETGKYETRDALYLIGNIVFLGLFFNLLIVTRSVLDGKKILLYLLLIAISTDTIAYFVGVTMGKHKFTKVSPKKSVEGTIAGAIAGTIIPTIYYINLIPSNLNIVVVIIMSFVLSALGQIGDLFFSKIKRENKIKDYSNIMPGHGGILDRVDSLSFIMIGYTVIISILNML